MTSGSQPPTSPSEQALGNQRPGPPTLGTWDDTYLPIYFALGLASRFHPQLSAAQVDELDITIVGMYLRANQGTSPGASFAEQAAAATAERLRSGTRGRVVAET